MTCWASKMEMRMERRSRAGMDGTGSMAEVGLWCTGLLRKCWLGFCAWPDLLCGPRSRGMFLHLPFQAHSDCPSSWLSMLLASKYMDTHTHTHTEAYTGTCISIDIHIMLVIFALSLWGIRFGPQKRAIHTLAAPSWSWLSIGGGIILFCSKCPWGLQSSSKCLFCCP